jgi:hypothetical protein
MKEVTTSSYSNLDETIAKYAKVLGHPARVAIIKLLLKKDHCICGDIVDELPLSQSTVSQHLKELKETGLIKGEISGVKTCYCIDEEVWDAAAEIMKEFFSINTFNKKCC